MHAQLGLIGPKIARVVLDVSGQVRFVFESVRLCGDRREGKPQIIVPFCLAFMIVGNVAARLSFDEDTAVPQDLIVEVVLPASDRRVPCCGLHGSSFADTGNTARDKNARQLTHT